MTVELPPTKSFPPSLARLENKHGAKGLATAKPFSQLLGALDPARARNGEGSGTGAQLGFGSALGSRWLAGPETEFGPATATVPARATTPGARNEESELGAESSLFDPTVRAAALLAPPPIPTTSDVIAQNASATETGAGARAAEVQALASAMVETAAFWGDGRKGLARLRFGRDARGGLAGATVVLESDGGAISLHIEGADEATIAAIEARLRISASP